MDLFHILQIVVDGIVESCAPGPCIELKELPTPPNPDICSYDRSGAPIRCGAPQQPKAEVCGYDQQGQPVLCIKEEGK